MTHWPRAHTRTPRSSASPNRLTRRCRLTQRGAASASSTRSSGGSPPTGPSAGGPPEASRQAKRLRKERPYTAFRTGRRMEGFRPNRPHDRRPGAARPPERAPRTRPHRCAAAAWSAPGPGTRRDRASAPVRAASRPVSVDAAGRHARRTAPGRRRPSPGVRPPPSGRPTPSSRPSPSGRPAAHRPRAAAHRPRAAARRPRPTGRRGISRGPAAACGFPAPEPLVDEAGGGLGERERQKRRQRQTPRPRGPRRGRSPNRASVTRETAGGMEGGAGLTWSPGTPPPPPGRGV